MKPIPYNQNQPANSQFILYQDVKSRITFHVRCDEDDIWLTQAQIATLFETKQQNISYHINKISKTGELQQDGTYKDFLLVRQEGIRSVKRQVRHYNMDMIVALCYRVKSSAAIRFRQWANERRKQLIIEKKRREVVFVAAK